MFTVYSKPNCQYCVRAKMLLEKKGLEYHVIDITEGSVEEQISARENLIERVAQITGDTPRTMPQIFNDDEYVGGFDQLDALLKDAEGNQ